MWKNIAFQSVFQLVVLFVFMAILPDGQKNAQYLRDAPVLSFFYDSDTVVYRKDTIIFNTFVFSQLFNELNARKITWLDWNILQNIHKSPMFIIVMVATVVLQVLIVAFGSYAVRVHFLEPQEWVYTIAIAFLSIPIGFIQHLVPIPAPLAKLLGKIGAARRPKKEKWAPIADQLKHEEDEVVGGQAEAYPAVPESVSPVSTSDAAEEEVNYGIAEEPAVEVDAEDVNVEEGSD
ncbi:hypothetical protein J8273_7101 [Carpediemonas membranifera]|uniref:Cation-transporting P-type ATPase C-terminal domain-containing protein n=1 Tax=Carpediemonas membranifera TaxID=201153 RepID=A0A8J6B175_9EUKA|nr:hypothetical protein J8273_7101 [Carpediemonas membranifera]|eukprot:KAG9390842.1 hypothetical protein J8273_7101 [Carpediemonas membranifera]